jgi:hypothetical protein
VQAALSGPQCQAEEQRIETSLQLAKQGMMPRQIHRSSE